MKTKAFILFGLLILIISSCSILSFYPFYTKDTLIKDDRIIGKWISQNNDEVWEISFPDTVKEGRYIEGQVNKKNEYTYLLKVYLGAEPYEWAEFWLHIFKLKNGDVYADFYPVDWSVDMEYLMMNMLSVHSFSRAYITDKLQFRSIDIDWFKNLLKENKIRIRHEESKSGSMLLTAKPEELQKFLLKYGNEKEAYPDEYNNITLRKAND